MLYRRQEADYLGCVSGYKEEKMKIDLDIGKGAVLPVPILNNSPVIFELEVKQFIPMDDSEVMLCKIRNVLQDENLSTKDKSDVEKLAAIAPVKTTCGRYFSYKGEDLELWGVPMKKLNK